jgi:peptidoglycan/LPS O-acetylase OafA/YrhL
MRYAPQLDGLRAVCVGFTILDHIGPHPFFLNGNVGVDVFFVLSGFLITTLLADEKHATGGVCLKCFYTRRLFRIVPLYYLTIVVYAISTYVLYRSRIDPVRWPEFQAAVPALVVFMGDYRPTSAGTMFGHAWTLAIEEKYYLLWPVLLLGLLRFPRNARYGTLLAFLFVSWVFLPDDHEARGYGGLAIGSLMGLINRDTERSVAERIISVSSYVYLAAVLFGYLLVVLIDGGRIHVLLEIASALLIVKLVEKPTAATRFLESKPLTFIGRRSYGVYLFHVLVANAVVTFFARAHASLAWYVVFGLTLGIAVFLASLSKSLLEDRMIALGKNLANRIGAREVPGDRLGPRDAKALR